MTKKTITYIVLTAIAAAVIYFAYDFYKKRMALSENSERIMNNPALRTQAEHRAARNKTSLKTEVNAMARTLSRAA